MDAPATPRHKRLAVADQNGSRASSTPPSHRKDLDKPFLSPSSRHSSPGIQGAPKVRPPPHEELVPRRLAVPSPVRVRDRDRTRKRLSEYHSVHDAVKLLKNAKRIVVLSGAGISTSLDIPDFRSDDGFYSRLSSKIGITTPEEFFSLEFFKHESESFWENVKPLLPTYAKAKNGSYQSITPDTDRNSSTHSNPRFSKTHAFLAMLSAKSKLLTNYTQNIDGLEHVAGVYPQQVVQCHGSWDTATCLTCNKSILARKYLPIVAQSGYPRCKCSPGDLQKKHKSPRKKKRKRHVYEGDSDHDSDDGTKTPGGLYKPDITFFGEPIPQYYVPRLESDKSEADLLIILGTSLKVRPVKTMLVEFEPHIPQIWINRDRFSGTNSDMPGVQVDIELLGDCDIVVEELCRRAGLDLGQYSWQKDRPHAGQAASLSQKSQDSRKDNLEKNENLAHTTNSMSTSSTEACEKKPKPPAITLNDNMMSHPPLIIGSPRSQNFSEQEPRIVDVVIAAQKSAYNSPQQDAKSSQKIDGKGNNTGANKLEKPEIAKSECSTAINEISRSTTVSKKQGQESKVKIDQDLDAEWRWRFTTKK